MKTIFASVALCLVSSFPARATSEAGPLGVPTGVLPARLHSGGIYATVAGQPGPILVIPQKSSVQFVDSVEIDATEIVFFQREFPPQRRHEGCVVEGLLAYPVSFVTESEGVENIVSVSPTPAHPIRICSDLAGVGVNLFGIEPGQIEISRRR